MRCPKCKSNNIGVVRTNNDPHHLKIRLRICYECKNVFNTVEKIEQFDNDPSYKGNKNGTNKKS